MSAELPSKTEVKRRAAVMSSALAEAARRARFSTRSRRGFSAGGFGARRGARAMQAFVWASFALLVALPTLAGALYYGLWASDQFVSEAHFTIAGGEVRQNAGKTDTFGAATGVPLEAIAQDTMIVTAYLESRAAVEAVDARLPLRRVYGDERIDRLSRFGRDEPVERLVDYWRDMTHATIRMPSGIVEFRARAFSAAEAQKIAQIAVELSERLINDTNQRMLADAVGSAESEARRAAERLGAARVRLEQARNEEGVLDAARAAESIEKLLAEVRSAVTRMEQEYQALLRAVRDTSPQMKALRARIDAGRGQMVELEDKLTATRAGQEKSMSASLTRFAALDLERQIAERLYAGAAATLELARLAAEHRLMYVKTFVAPVLPEEPLYPKRALNTALIFLGGLAAWSALVGLATLTRNNMA